MKNLFSTVALVVALLLLGSCATTQQGIRGFYAPTNVVTTDLEYEKVWSKVIDFFAESSIPIGVLDKSSGLITATSVSFGNKHVSVENKYGEIINPEAWFVVPYFKGMTVVGGRAECSFNVRVKALENGKTTIQINLNNLVGYYDVQYFNSMTLRKEIIRNTYPRECQSTGKFEYALLNYLK